MKRITVLIVDDSALIRKVYSELLSDIADIEVIGTAVDAQDARAKIKQLNPQVITLDVEMPGMNGLSFLEKIMSLRPMPVIMASTLTHKGAEATIRALELGAFDTIAKPAGTQTHDTLCVLKDELITKIRAAAQANITASKGLTAGTASRLSFFPPVGQVSMIAIGSSTGGVEALREIFQQLPSNCPPIVITQHMPKQFTPSFAERLNSLSEVNVTEAETGLRLKVGQAYLAPGGRHLSIKKQGKEWICHVEEGMPVSGHQPSVDVLFSSVAAAAGNKAVGIILTGMGKDGAAGMLRMREEGAYTIGQSESSCVVYGMPKAAKSLGAVQTELPLCEIPAHLLSYLSQERKASHG
jgi:two-component system chemotaxis response regulator CheB